VLGGVELDFPRGLAGHSDADVLTHAVMDALLGAVAGGDIGRLFPDTDPAWKDARSTGLLKRVAREVERRGAVITSIDATVLAEEPKLEPHIAAMQECLARVLDLDVGAVSVKATTLEGMGAVGRKEGVSALAIATVETAEKA
jgi:2-C-methyl-D-erythritol 2,4-cyclodiphosphate synthase